MAAKRRHPTTKQAVESALAEHGGGPMAMRELIPLVAAQANLKGHVAQTVYGVVYGEARKKDGIFVRTGRGEVALNPKTVAIIGLSKGASSA
jgi:hypothetical protein